MTVLSFGRKQKLPVWLTYLALFSWINFFTWSYHRKKLKLIGNLSDCPLILTVGKLTHKQQNWVWEFFLSKYFFNESDFCTNTPYFFILLWKCSVTFPSNWVWQITDMCFLALWAWKLRDTLNKRKTKLALTSNVQKVIQVLAFSRSWKVWQFIFFFQNCWFSLIASPISFHLI